MDEWRWWPNCGPADIGRYGSGAGGLYCFIVFIVFWFLVLFKFAFAREGKGLNLRDKSVYDKDFAFNTVPIANISNCVRCGHFSW